MKLKINQKEYYIKSLSKLTFKEFNKIIGDGNAIDLPSYLSLFCDIPIDQLNSAQLTGFNIPAAHQLIFNIDIEKVIKDKKETVIFRDQAISMESLRFKTFGQSYAFEMIRQQKPNEFELSVYALAIALSTSLDPEYIKEVYNELSHQIWTKVLPQGFFLHKKFCNSKMALISLYLRFTLKLKIIKWKLQASRMKFQKQEKTGQRNY